MNETGIVVTIVLYFLVLIVIMLLTSKEASNDSFFTGEKSSPWYLVAFGMIGASLSGVTFLSVPGTVGSGGFSYMQVVFGYFIGYLIVANFLIPLFYKYNVISIYEYLNGRYGKMSHKVGAFYFLLSRILGASIRLYLVAIVLQSVLFDAWGVPFFVTVTVSILLIWLYTFKGGIKTIVWTDTLQTAFMLAAVGIAIYILQLDLGENMDVFYSLKSSDMTKIFHFESIYQGNHFFKSFLGGMFITIGMTGLDQDMMQKNLSCKNAKESKKNMLTMASLLVVVNLVFLYLGALLFTYAQNTGVGAEAISQNRTDLLFSSIAIDNSTGQVLGIMFLLGLIAAAYSSADSALTSLTTSVSVDFLDIQNRPEHKQKNIRMTTHVVMSVVLILAVIILERFASKDAITLLLQLSGLTYGPLIALYFFGIMSKRRVEDLAAILVSITGPIIIGLLWAFSSGGILQQMYGLKPLFGEYIIGAELIVYNSILCILGLTIFSKNQQAV